MQIDRASDEGTGGRERQSRSGAPAVRTSPGTRCTEPSRLQGCGPRRECCSSVRALREVETLVIYCCVPCYGNCYCLVLCLNSLLRGLC